MPTTVKTVLVMAKEVWARAGRSGMVGDMELKFAINQYPTSLAKIRIRIYVLKSAENQQALQSSTYYAQTYRNQSSSGAVCHSSKIRK